jgi:hypothetical protein
MEAFPLVADGFCRIVQPFAIRERHHQFNVALKNFTASGFGPPSTRNLSAPTSRAIFSGGSKALPSMRPAAGRQVFRRPEG